MVAEIAIDHPDRLDPIFHSMDTFFDLLNRDQRTTLSINRTVGERNGGDVRNVFGFGRKDVLGAAAAATAATAATAAAISNSTLLFAKFVKKTKSEAKERTRKRLNRNRFTGRLGEVFVVGVCLLTLVRVPSAMSAPSAHFAKTTEKIHSRGGGREAPDDLPNYMYPCGKSHEEEINKYYLSSKESDSEILKHIIIRTKSALSYAESFRDRYVESTFHLSFDQHHAQWANQKYDWLPNEGNGIPKRLGKDVDPIHLESKTFDEFLINIYEHLQKFAVGLEQVVWDQKKTNGKFQENFRMAEVHLRNVLCEIRMAMIERNVIPRDHVPRSIMKDDFRHLESASYRNLRDWFIFRDMMNSLEYVIQVFTFIEENLPPLSATTSS